MDVDYQGFAAQMGNNNRQAIASLMQLIQSNKESKRLEQKDAQARQLQDLQLAKLKEEQAYQEGLKKAMAAPQSTTELTQAPVQPLPSLATLGLNRPDYVSLPSAAPVTQNPEDVAGLKANVEKYPGLAKLAGADQRLERMSYGTRPDGSQKGSGYFGELKTPDGRVATELTIGVNFDGKEQNIPLIVPTLDQSELSQTLAGKPPRSAIDKAVAHAKDRMAQGKDPYASLSDARPVPSLVSLGGLPEFAPQPPNVQAPMLPGVAQTTKTETPTEAAIRFATSQGRTEEAAKYINLNEAMAKQAARAKAYGNTEKAAEYEANMEKMTKASTLISELKKSGGVQFAKAQAAKMPEYFANIDLSQLSSDGQINKYALPNGQYAVWSDDNPGTIHLTAAPSEAAANAHQVQEIPSADGRTAQKFQYNPQTKRYDIPLGEKYMVKSQVPNVNVHVKGSGGGSGHGGMNIKMNGLNPAQTDALTTAIGEGRLDPYKINSKNQQILADAALKNPGIDLNDMAANLGLARNKDVQMKGAIAETVPPLLKSIVENGKKLNYSDNKFLGMAQQWIDKTTNNPQLVKYMTLRNDQLLTLGGIMRSGGMTDMAQKLEEEAAHPTMSPKALEAWLEGQMESVAPRLNMYRSIRGGKGAPRPAASPAAAAPPPPKTFDALPSPAGLTGRTITDSHTGKRYRSDGKSWRPM